MQKTTFSTIFLTSLITALLVIGFYHYLSYQDTNTTQQEILTPSLSESEDLDTPEQKTVAIPNFNTIEEYAMLVSDSSQHGTYKVNRPEGFQRINFGGIDLNIGLDGVSADIYVLAALNRPNSLDTSETFYLEVINQAPCFKQTDCDEAVSEYFGPFECKLGRMTQ